MHFDTNTNIFPSGSLTLYRKRPQTKIAIRKKTLILFHPNTIKNNFLPIEAIINAPGTPNANE